jgi:sugar fermentation stimulation protein A
MMGLLRPGIEILLSPGLHPGRRLPYTLELVRNGEFWVGVNTLTPNRLLKLAWTAGVMPELTGYDHFKTEPRIGESRLDAFLSHPGGELWIETKNVTLVEDDVAYFPDAVTQRGQRHLRELTALARKGHRAACFFLIQRQDARCFAPADFIDPDFSSLLYEAMAEGVEVWPYRATVSPLGIGLGEHLPFKNER